MRWGACLVKVGWDAATSLHQGTPSPALASRASKYQRSRPKGRSVSGCGESSTRAWPTTPVRSLPRRLSETRRCSVGKTIGQPFRVALLVGLGIGPWACGDDTTAGSTSNGDSSAELTCPDIPRSRTLSQSCCTEHGIDACGAELFCAAFDGRAVATCYPLYSRRGLETCLADTQCVSEHCNLQTGLCRSDYAEGCKAATGCAQANRTCTNVCPGYSDCTPGCNVPCELECM